MFIRDSQWISHYMCYPVCIIPLTFISDLLPHTGCSSSHFMCYPIMYTISRHLFQTYCLHTGCSSSYFVHYPILYVYNPLTFVQTCCLHTRLQLIKYNVTDCSWVECILHLCWWSVVRFQFLVMSHMLNEN